LCVLCLSKQSGDPVHGAARHLITPTCHAIASATAEVKTKAEALATAGVSVVNTKDCHQHGKHLALKIDNKFIFIFRARMITYKTFLAQLLDSDPHDPLE
ncbi:MAG: hypothetical protein V3W19_16990, partial [Desulfatiglandales bacterium]